MNAIAGVYRYSDIVLMTDEEENKDTDRWPSMENIVSFSPGSRTHVLTTENCSCGRSIISFVAHLPVITSCFIVQFYATATLLSLVDHFFLDAGHCGQLDDGEHQCACGFFTFSCHDKAIATLGINTCDDKSISGEVSITHSFAIQY